MLIEVKAIFRVPQRDPLSSRLIEGCASTAQLGTRTRNKTEGGDRESARDRNGRRKKVATPSTSPHRSPALAVHLHLHPAYQLTCIPTVASPTVRTSHEPNEPTNPPSYTHTHTPYHHTPPPSTGFVLKTSVCCRFSLNLYWTTTLLYTPYTSNHYRHPRPPRP